MLPEKARAVIGQPHPSGKGALRMLEAEGFMWDGYVDIFDGGPTVVARTDQIKAVADSRALTVIDRARRGGDRDDAPRDRPAGTNSALASAQVGECRRERGRDRRRGAGNCSRSKPATRSWSPDA